MSDSSFVAVDFDSFLVFVNDSCTDAAANDPDYVGLEGDDAYWDDTEDAWVYPSDNAVGLSPDALAILDRLRRSRLARDDDGFAADAEIAAYGDDPAYLEEDDDGEFLAAAVARTFQAHLRRRDLARDLARSLREHRELHSL